MKLRDSEGAWWYVAPGEIKFQLGVFSVNADQEEAGELTTVEDTATILVTDDDWYLSVGTSWPIDSVALHGTRATGKMLYSNCITQLFKHAVKV